MPYFPPAPGGSSGPLVEYHRILTSAEIKALFTTPIVLVAGVANKLYAVQSCLIIHRFGGTAYSNVSGSLVIQVGSTGWVTFPANILAETASHFYDYNSNTNLPDGALTAVEGQDLNIQDDTQNPTLGNGTLEVFVRYIPTDV